MALSLLELVGLDRGSVQFSIDTGTNVYYQLRAGRSVRPNAGIHWVDDVFFTTPLAKNARGGQLFGTSRTVALPLGSLRPLNGGNVYVQLFSFKDTGGRLTRVFYHSLGPPGD